MTADHTPDDHTPGETTDHAETADRVRRTLTAVADRHPASAAGWDDVRTRIATGDAGSPTLSAPARLLPVRRSRRVLAAAAVALAVAGIAGVVALAVGNGKGDDRTEPLVADQPGGPVTGWYVPSGLPDGWTLDTVSVTPISTDCPCRQAVWSDATWTRRLMWATETIPPGSSVATVNREGVDEVPLSGGVTATLIGRGDAAWTLAWKEGGVSQSLSAIGIDPDLAGSLAEGRRTTPDPDVAPLDGLILRSEGDDATLATDVQLDVILVTPSGRRVGYSLSSPAFADPLAVSYGPEERTLPGQPLPLLASLPFVDRTPSYVGRWPGATVRSSYATEADGSIASTDDDTLALLASLRPATTAEWRTFIEGADGRSETPEWDARATDAPTLAALITDLADA